MNSNLKIASVDFSKSKKGNKPGGNKFTNDGDNDKAYEHESENALSHLECLFKASFSLTSLKTGTTAMVSHLLHNASEKIWYPVGDEKGVSQPCGAQ
jgi:hypothetical protein